MARIDFGVNPGHITAEEHTLYDPLPAAAFSNSRYSFSLFYHHRYYTRIDFHPRRKRMSSPPTALPCWPGLA